MKILNVVPSYYPAVRYGGPIKSVHGLARALASQGHEVHVYTTDVDGPSNSDVPLGRPVQLDGVLVWYFPTSMGRRLYHSPKMDQALKRNLVSFDVVHIHSVFLWPTTAAARAARAHGIPYILAPRGMLVAELIQRRNRFTKKAWIAAFERRNIEEAAAIHATSPLEADDIRRLGLRYRRMLIVPNGTEMPMLGADLINGTGLDRGRPTILFLGRINWKKGLDRLIRAMMHLPEADLAIAGNDDENYRNDLEALARELNVVERVRFLGPVYGREKWTLLMSAQILALPSYSENFGNTALEAMAVGCPVVVTPEVGLAGVVSETGAGLVVPGTPESLAKAMQSILESPDKARAMGEIGCSTVMTRFTWDAIASQMEIAYRQITGRAEENATVVH